MTVGIATGEDVEPADQDDHLLLDALVARGLDAELAVWDDETVDWSRYDAVVIRSTWDYTGRRDDYVAWAQRVDEATDLYNPAEVIRWNTHKGYLIELEDRGAPIVPTAWLAQGDRIDLGDLIEQRGWKRAVAKPAVGAGAEGLVRIEPDQVELAQHHLDALLRTGDVMVQPYVGSIETDGELSLVLVDGEVTHAVRKRPRPGEIRIQIEHGGLYDREDPDPDLASLAEWIVETTGHDLLYARVDLVFDDLGSPLLSELEATEPSLYLGWAPDAAAVLAAAVESRL